MDRFVKGKLSFKAGWKEAFLPFSQQCHNLDLASVGCDVFL